MFTFDSATVIIQRLLLKPVATKIVDEKVGTNLIFVLRLYQFYLIVKNIVQI